MMPEITFDRMSEEELLRGLESIDPAGTPRRLSGNFRPQAPPRWAARSSAVAFFAADGRFIRVHTDARVYAAPILLICEALFLRCGTACR